MYKHHPSCQIDALPRIYRDTFGYKVNGRFVEVGAFNCDNWSNTRTLTMAGWNGLVVEPNPEYISKCYDVLNVIVEQCAAGKASEKAKLYLGGSNTTIKQKMVDVYNATEWAKFSGLRHDNFIEVDVFPLNTILERNNWEPEFEVLSIDVEGAEIDVLKGFLIDRWQPKLVIVETHELNKDRNLSRKARWINLYFKKYCYRKIYTDEINSIYVIN